MDTAGSVNVTVPVLLRAGGADRYAKLPPSTERSRTKYASLVALSRQVSATDGPAARVATTLVGACGGAGTGPPTGADTDSPAAFTATIR
ncbi:hypothetical protein PSR1_03513 [Anaeromyxobacter sp. PSR-1]|nr:hypothetical protein PSR1_03513 [Anaeromyxobacter sp. PSR-1]